jgi:hypothetical protein
VASLPRGGLEPAPKPRQHLKIIIKQKRKFGLILRKNLIPKSRQYLWTVMKNKGYVFTWLHA